MLCCLLFAADPGGGGACPVGWSQGPYAVYLAAYGPGHLSVHLCPAAECPVEVIKALIK